MHGPDGRARRPPGEWSALAARGRRALRNRWDVLLVVSAGGVVGSLARWGIGVALPHRAGDLPWATVVVNLTGCLLLGVLMVLVLEVWPPSRYARPFLGTGVLGGFTTFSTYMLDARTLAAAGRPFVAGAYLAISLIGGVVAVWGGTATARLMLLRAPVAAGLRRGPEDPPPAAIEPHGSGVVEPSDEISGSAP